MNPIPPTTLSKETERVWYGWCNIGDKEVAREAAAKGLHINLAINFLSLRKKIDFNDAQIWFKDEVLRWVFELLERKQIFKASHVLNNIGCDVRTELSRIFYTTHDGKLRDYVGSHLKKIKSLDENLENLWDFLRIISENSVVISKYSLSIESLECLDKQSESTKSELATVLFLETEDAHLSKFIDGERLWKHLLVKSDLNNLLLWINLKFKQVDQFIEGNLVEQFKKFEITNDMLKLIENENLNIGTDVKNTIYNELATFGIFQCEEKNDLTMLLKRLTSSFNLGNIYHILTKNSSVLNVNDFICLLVNYCWEKKYFNVLNVCVENFEIPSSATEIKLIYDFRFLTKNYTEETLSENIYNVASMLSEDVSSYFIQNPVIFLCLLFFTEDVEIADMLIIGKKLTVKDLSVNNCTLSLLRNFQILNQICVNQYVNTSVCKIGIYDLINRHLKFDFQCVFDFCFLNMRLSNFNIPDMLQTFVYSKEVNYKFYLKQGRPSAAMKFFILNDFETLNLISSTDVKRIEKQIYKLAITNFNNQEICSSCIFWLDCNGLDSIKLRLLIKIARILYNPANYENDFLLDLLLNSDDEPYNLQNILEQTLMGLIDSNLMPNGCLLTEAFQTIEIIILHSKINSLKLPELFLKYCASHNFWLPFLLLAQIYDYPLEQVKLLIQFFKSPNMLEHLTHGVLNDIQVEEKNILIRERDSRKYLLSKVGVRQSIEFVNQQTSAQSIKSQSSYGSVESTSSSDKFEIDISNIKATLLQTLIRCHDSTDPPKAFLQACQLYRNPLLSIFATSYEPDSIITNWLTWLSVSCELCKVFTNYETTAISANSVCDLLVNCVKNRYPKTLLESFEIFLPENPLKPFLEFLNYCNQLNFNNTTLIQKLDQFVTLLKQFRTNTIIVENDHDMTYMTNKIWIEMVALKLLGAILEYGCNSLYEQVLIVEKLCNIEISNYFSSECVNFDKLLRILQTLFINTNVRLDISIIFDSKNSRQAIISCINELLDKQHYDVALKISKIENLPADLILIKEWQSQMSDRNDQNFWLSCNESLIKNNVTADCVVDFYQDCLEKSCDLFEKFTLSKLAWKWATKYDLSCQYELERKMWLLFLYLDEKYKDFNICDMKTSSSVLYKDLMEELQNVAPHDGDLKKEFLIQLERIVAVALEKNNFWLALKLEKIFGCKSADLETLKLYHNLAEGMILPHQLNAEQRLLLSNVNYMKSYSHRRTFLSARFSSLSSSSYSAPNLLQMHTADNVDCYVNDTLAILKLLLEHLHSGVEIAEKIFMNYRISINIEIPYDLVVTTTDHMKMLKDALDDDCVNKIDVIHDFIISFKWSKHETADFICEELINATTFYIESNVDHIIMWDVNIDQDFQVILQLLQDNCSSLGYKLYSYTSALHKSQIESEQLLKSKVLTLVIELLIKAHDCFTADCNMEGISVILKKSKEVVANLLVLQDWKLMVRLLTGVARYTEMNYVFQILKENDQFEFLLRKGLRKDNTLKVALLEYLKKYCPDSRDLYKIVALHFALFSEVAILWEREAQNIIKNLISVSILEMQNNKLDPEEEFFVLLQNTESTKKCLKKAMENYIHATDFHLQGEKLTKAAEAVKQAELIALQLSFLNEVNSNASVVCLLNLKSSQIVSLMTSRLNFEQSLILSDAYNFHTDWASVLYEQYVTKDNNGYLDSFLLHLPMTDGLLHDISRKFIDSGINSLTEIKSMKHILKRFGSPYMKYKIASELGFTDLVEDQIASGCLVYLKDTVWKKGYKN